MSRIRKLIATAGMFMLGSIAIPVAHSQPLPGGSVELPAVEPMPVAVPPGSVAQQLPPLPFPFFWVDHLFSPPAAPTYVASNWVVPFSGCPAANQRAFAQDGTQLWCTYLDLTDARVWAPYTSNVPWTPDFRLKPLTRVTNSLGGQPCGPVGNGYRSVEWTASPLRLATYRLGHPGLAVQARIVINQLGPRRGERK